MYSWIQALNQISARYLLEYLHSFKDAITEKLQDVGSCIEHCACMLFEQKKYVCNVTIYYETKFQFLCLLFFSEEMFYTYLNSLFRIIIGNSVKIYKWENNKKLHWMHNSYQINYCIMYTHQHSYSFYCPTLYLDNTQNDIWNTIRISI